MLKKRLTALLTLTMIAASGTTVSAEEIEVPREVVEISEELSAQYDICPELIQAMCFKESSFRTDVESDGNVGIMQVNPKWHKGRMERLWVADIFDMRGNMVVGVDYLSELIVQYEDVSVALMVYNGDSSAEDVAGDSGDVSGYAEEILTISEELERKNGK